MTNALAYALPITKSTQESPSTQRPRWFQSSVYSLAARTTKSTFKKMTPMQKALNIKPFTLTKFFSGTYIASPTRPPFRFLNMSVDLTGESITGNTIKFEHSVVPETVLTSIFSPKCHVFLKRQPDGVFERIGFVPPRLAYARLCH